MEVLAFADNLPYDPDMWIAQAWAYIFGVYCVTIFNRDLTRYAVWRSNNRTVGRRGAWLLKWWWCDVQVMSSAWRLFPPVGR